MDNKEKDETTKTQEINYQVAYYGLQERIKD